MGGGTMRERIVVAINRLGDGLFYVDSPDLPELNIAVGSEAGLTVAIPTAIKLIYKKNRNLDVRVLMEVPVFERASDLEPQREVEILDAA